MVHDLVSSLLVPPGAVGGQPHSCVYKMSEFFQCVILVFINLMNSDPLMSKFVSLHGNMNFTIQKKLYKRSSLSHPSLFAMGFFLGEL